MSRTFRRKKKKPDDIVTHDYILVGKSLKTSCGRYKADWQWIPYEGKELKKNIAKWHTSDTSRGVHSPPSWFVNVFFTRKQRSNERDQLRKMLVDGDFENYCFNPHKRSAGWYWW